MKSEDNQDREANTKYKEFTNLEILMEDGNVEEKYQTPYNQLLHHCMHEYAMLLIYELVVLSKSREGYYKRQEVSF